VYSIFDYGGMLLDEVRVRAYLAALERYVKPESIVVDVGAGTGFFALYACKLGARHVHAIEPNPAIEIARAIAKENGWADRMTFHHAQTNEVDLSERADVIVWDVRGQLALLGIESLVDARDRLLAPGGAFLPARDRLMVAFVESEALYDRLVAPWDEARAGFSQRAAREAVLQAIHTDRHAPLTEADVLSEPREWATLEFATIKNGSVGGRATTRFTRDGKAHALAIWFESTIAEGISFSTGPAPTSMVYSRMVLPLEDPISVRAGDEALLSLSALPSLADYIWTWEGDVRRDGQRVAGFKQSSFYSEPLAIAELRRTTPSFSPKRNLAGEIEHAILSAFDGHRSNEIIAEEIVARFPHVLRSKASALAEVKRVAQKLGR
jgi:precorrin-6B methylase 2